MVVIINTSNLTLAVVSEHLLCECVVCVCVCVRVCCVCVCCVCVCVVFDCVSILTDISRVPEV